MGAWGWFSFLVLGFFSELLIVFLFCFSSDGGFALAEVTWWRSLEISSLARNRFPNPCLA